MKRLCLFLLFLPALVACQWMTEYDDDDDAYLGFPQYINITVSISAGSNSTTRANPNGGEYGDGWEKGIDDPENVVNDITLIFFQDEAGINTTNTNTEVLCVKKYNVEPYKGGNHTHDREGHISEPPFYYQDEILYTTGDQRLDEIDLQVGQTYNVLVVANADPDVSVNEKITDVRDKVFSQIYEINDGVVSNFVMTSEIDAKVTLRNPTVKKEENKSIYYFECIHIERLAARIDYCTKGATYSDTYKGYKYDLGTSDDDGFWVVKKVTPFNLYDDDEYLFKRVCGSWTNDNTPVGITFLGDETTNNYVVDPNTASKTVIGNGVINYYLNPMPQRPPHNLDDSYTLKMEDVHSNFFIDGDGNKNIIIAYPKENTLLPGSLLKKYATGIVFEAVFYPPKPTPPGPPGPPAPAPTRAPGQDPRVFKYYHYLRHQGESDDGVYQAKELKADKIDHDDETCGDVPMKCGVVRNNIYRISIESFNTVEGSITIKIEEEHWRHVDNPVIYI